MFAFWQKDLTYEGESIYNYLQVYENEENVVLSTNVLFGVQSVYQKNGGMTGMYYDYAMAAPYMSGIYDKDNFSMLILGNGTGTYATQCKRYFGQVDIEAVEIDQKITDLAREYFELPEDGVMVVNMNMRGAKEGNINQYLADTISSVFSEVYTVDVKGATNRELFASNNSHMLARFAANLEMENEEQLSAMMNRVESGLARYVEGSYIMTDDKAPVELLGMQMIDELIRDEVSYYRKVFDEGGIEALINLL